MLQLSKDALLRNQELCRRLRAALPTELADVALEQLPDKGLAHDHVRLKGTGWLARVPKQSQMGHGAEANLVYQAACFRRAASGGHAPRLRAVLPPGPGLPRGALIVEDINGRAAQLPDDLPAIARALATFHALPLPDAADRPPLLDAPDPLTDLLREVGEQAEYLSEARLDAAATRVIQREIALFEQSARRGARPAKALISFDAHPGNFIVRSDGRAVLVDLEKARYSYPSLDLAHATLYTSTTWDVDTRAELTVDQVLSFYSDWSEAMGVGGLAWQPWHIELRRGMWLWSVTWCAKWRVLS